MNARGRQLRRRLGGPLFPEQQTCGWSRDVTVDIADELRRRYVEYDEVPALILRFLEAANRH